MTARVELMQAQGVPTETGAYWAGFPGIVDGLEICWIHEGAIWFAPAWHGDWRRAEEYVSRGFVFYGPIPKPETLPFAKSVQETA